MGNYNKTEQFYLNKEKVAQDHTPKGINEVYWNEFVSGSGKTDMSLAQYKSAINRFTSIVNKDILLINKDDIENYLIDIKVDATRKNADRYIKSFIRFTIENHAERFNEVDDELLMDLIPSDYRKLVQMMMNK